MGLALAAVTLTEKVEERTPERSLRLELSRMRDDALETQARSHGEAATLPVDVADELRATAQRTKNPAGELSIIWLKSGADAVAAWTFLAMGEAGEFAAWLAVTEVTEPAADAALLDLARWALETRRRHLETAFAGTVALAGAEQPLHVALQLAACPAFDASAASCSASCLCRSTTSRARSASAQAVGHDSADERHDEHEHAVHPQLRDVGSAEEHRDPVGSSEEEDQRHPQDERDPDRRAPRGVARTVEQVVEPWSW